MSRTGTNRFVLLSATLAAWAFAPGHAIAGDEEPDIYIVSADIGGSGCPEGTASTVLSDDKRTVTIIFDEYRVEDTDYGSCNIAVALSVPPGISIALVDIDYRGYGSIPDHKGRKGRFRAEYFFAGDTGPVRSEDFPRGYEGSFLISHNISGLVWAPCGAEVIARANTSLRTWGKESFLAIDTADVTTNRIIFYLDWHYC